MSEIESESLGENHCEKSQISVDKSETAEIKKVKKKCTKKVLCEAEFGAPHMPLFEDDYYEALSKGIPMLPYLTSVQLSRAHTITYHATIDASQYAYQ